MPRLFFTGAISDIQRLHVQYACNTCNTCNTSIRYLMREKKERFGEGFVSRYWNSKQNLQNNCVVQKSDLVRNY